MQRLFAAAVGILALATCGAHCSERCPPPSIQILAQRPVTAVARVLVGVPPMDGAVLRVRPTRRLIAYGGSDAALRARVAPCAASVADGGTLLVADEETPVQTPPSGALLLVPVCGDEAPLPWSATITYAASVGWANDPIHGQCVGPAQGPVALYLQELP